MRLKTSLAILLAAVVPSIGAATIVKIPVVTHVVTPVVINKVTVIGPTKYQVGVATQPTTQPLPPATDCPQLSTGCPANVHHMPSCVRNNCWEEAPILIVAQPVKAHPIGDIEELAF
jgi:hypothetical protein